MRLLLGSGGIRTPERKDAWMREWNDFLGAVDGLEKVLFVPWAIHNADEQTERTQEWLGENAVTLDGIHTHADPVEAVENADAIFVTGGNTFRLVTRIYEAGILDVVRQRVHAGLPYIGISAGTNVATPTLATTNDMPICFPPSDKTFDLVPFQINPHFVPGKAHYVIDGEIEAYAGETREDRLNEYHEENTTPVLCLREGAILRYETGTAMLRGTAGGFWMEPGKEPTPLAVDSDISHMWPQ